MNLELPKMKKLAVFIQGVYAGLLVQHSRHDYEFRYDDLYRSNPVLPSLCLNMPKSKPVYRSEYLFPLFANMLSEGYNRRLQGRILRIDEHDDFALLSDTAQYDTIGAITVKPVRN